ncbi:hypothetical protein GGTG_06329 [Gaeumannomyces tritici R3-111a-1]|uniref:Uncharacterized protein n=1 Tax=Gaeumannomyces tritici (strain R3-111a-1) TaxID=644352 RepID=J3NYH7_GAET3|nr:hypothetical protein GGTG_06329 [Gaeumannomyces tritici R3-111a-1]EJT76410.1 hypothetical protein GGTG_06329 [Gaeumannomyces tritici R3-111a-1]
MAPAVVAWMARAHTHTHTHKVTHTPIRKVWRALTLGASVVSQFPPEKMEGGDGLVVVVVVVVARLSFYLLLRRIFRPTQGRCLQGACKNEDFPPSQQRAQHSPCSWAAADGPSLLGGKQGTPIRRGHHKRQTTSEISAGPRTRRSVRPRHTAQRPAPGAKR